MYSIIRSSSGDILCLLTLKLLRDRSKFRHIIWIFRTTYCSKGFNICLIGLQDMALQRGELKIGGFCILGEDLLPTGLFRVVLLLRGGSLQISVTLSSTMDLTLSIYLVHKEHASLVYFIWIWIIQMHWHCVYSYNDFWVFEMFLFFCPHILQAYSSPSICFSEWALTSSILLFLETKLQTVHLGLYFPLNAFFVKYFVNFLQYLVWYNYECPKRHTWVVLSFSFNPSFQ